MFFSSLYHQYLAQNGIKKGDFCLIMNLMFFDLLHKFFNPYEFATFYDIIFLLFFYNLL